MPKRFFFLSVILFFPILIFAQHERLKIMGSGGQFYLNHIVVPKENFYSVGRLYNVSPRDLATSNHLSLDKGLKVGQTLKIPLNNANFIQNTNTDAAEALVPVYHQVSAGETLFRIGHNYGDIPLDRLKEWNNLQNDNVKKGADMIVGFLRVNKNESALALRAYKGMTGGNTNTVAVTPSPNSSREERPLAGTTASTNSNNPSPNGNDSHVPEKPAPVVQTPQVKNTSKEGFFKTEFDQFANKTEASSVSGTAAVFKSTSGWQDAKYYCFNNDALPGSIVRIEVPGTSKFIYAKVLDAIPDIKQNEGLTVVLSNAGADALGVDSDKFDVVLRFYK